VGLSAKEIVLDSDKQLTVVEHLEELRKRLWICIIAVSIFSIAGFYIVDRVIKALAANVGTFVFLYPTEAFLVKLKFSVYLGIFFAFPVILFEIWQYVVSALTPTEKKKLLFLITASYILFVAGVLFSYFMIVPQGTKFLLSYQTPYLKPFISIDQYVDIAAFFCIAFGVVFQLPIVTIFLTAIGFLTPQKISRGRKYVIVGIFIAAGVLTPGPDVFSQLMMAIPAYALFELSVLVSYLIKRKRQ
jgi:sec-independent protein translocase protein TatC